MRVIEEKKLYVTDKGVVDSTAKTKNTQKKDANLKDGKECMLTEIVRT